MLTAARSGTLALTLLAGGLLTATLEHRSVDRSPTVELTALTGYPLFGEVFGADGAELVAWDYEQGEHPWRKLLRMFRTAGANVFEEARFELPTSDHVVSIAVSHHRAVVLLHGTQERAELRFYEHALVWRPTQTLALSDACAQTYKPIHFVADTLVLGASSAICIYEPRAGGWREVERLPRGSTGRSPVTSGDRIIEYDLHAGLVIYHRARSGWVREATIPEPADARIRGVAAAPGWLAVGLGGYGDDRVDVYRTATTIEKVATLRTERGLGSNLVMSESALFATSSSSLLLFRRASDRWRFAERLSPNDGRIWHLGIGDFAWAGAKGSILGFATRP